MAEFRLRLEKLEPGRVRGTIWDVDSGEMSGSEMMIFQAEVAQDYTRKAQKEVVHILLRYLNGFVDLSHGGAD